MHLTSVLSFSGLACLFAGVSGLVITGPTTGGVQPRLEIRQLQSTQPEQWNLFIQGLEQMQAVTQTDVASYYQIAGIHGAPWVAWDGVEASADPNNGYCTHASNLFGPWHRPYLSLVEQRLSFFANQIAAQFPAGAQRDKYTAAARNLRLPYWDWALVQTPVIPASVMQSAISVTRPNGQSQTIENPLSLYRFHPLDRAALIQSPQNRFPTTVRAPDSRGASNNRFVEQVFEQTLTDRRQDTYNFLITPGAFDAVTNKAFGSVANNLESIHDNVHGNFQGGSHMSSPLTAAFDPVFWLHHANVDRLLALWQYSNPQTWITPAQQPGTFTVQAGSSADGTSPLTPFHKNAQGDFWTSNDVQNTAALAYTYPELQGNPALTSLRQQVNDLYAVAPGVSAKVEPTPPTEAHSPLASVPHVNVTLQTEPGDIVYSYTAEISMPMALNDKPYGVFVFLGEPTKSDPTQWIIDPNVAGSQNSFSAAMSGNPDSVPSISANCFLTRALLERYDAGELPSLDRDTVEAYLTKNLSWRAQQEGQVLPASTDIDVHLQSTAIQIPRSDEFYPKILDSHTIGPIERGESA